jgi:hypothetical protein
MKACWDSKALGNYGIGSQVTHRKPGNARTEKTNGALVYLLLIN